MMIFLETLLELTMWTGLFHYMWNKNEEVRPGLDNLDEENNLDL